jgi:hypothetical protein
VSSPWIIVAEAHDHWNAWFDGRPMPTFGGTRLELPSSACGKRN